VELMVTAARRSVAELREIRAVRRALRENVRRGYMEEVEHDRFKLTKAGEEYVLGMFERGSNRGMTKYGRLR
jgi:predicted transcriptional regulator